MKSNCTEYDKEFLEVQNSSKVSQYNTDYAELYRYLTEHTGKVINDIEDVESLYNTLEIYQMKNMSLPYWVNDTLLAQMRVIAAQNLAIYSETEYMKKMKGGIAIFENYYFWNYIYSPLHCRFLFKYSDKLNGSCN